jgi:hypothetical protein
MGHGVAKDLYTRLGEKIDHLSMRVPNNEAFYALLKEVFSHDQAGRCQERCRFFSLYFETLPAPSEGLVWLG